MEIGIIVGSLRKESYNRKIAHVLMQLASASFKMKIIEIGDLSLFNQDLESNPPKAWSDFRTAIQSLNGFLFITPEYNRGMPAAIKNALDIGSRPYGNNLWVGKACGVISSSVGMMGGFGANHQLRQTLAYLDMPCMGQPEIYLSTVDKLLDENGQLNNDKTHQFLTSFMRKFETWIAKFN